MSSKSVIKTTRFRPLRDSVYITELETGMTKSAGGIILGDDNMKDHGIRPRWGRIYAVGPEVTEVKVGQWILTEHARWTNKITMEINGESVDLWRVDYPAAVVLVTDEDPRTNAAFKF